MVTHNSRKGAVAANGRKICKPPCLIYASDML
ncbi:MAG: hypothetical protein RIR68_2808, partial [Pseudomonadota bacterium]